MTTTRLIIARHGNTFTADQNPTRVGARTDLPLVEKGQSQAAALGTALKTQGMIPDVIFTSNLKRTIETAEIAAKNGGFSNIPRAINPIFNEIDYGPDENKEEPEVIARLGQEALKQWDEKAIVPDGWLVDPDQIRQNWKNFAHEMRANHDGKTILIVTSNGIARFAGALLDNESDFQTQHSIKLSTGAYGVLEDRGGAWHVQSWNIRP
jgi:probable phosphoglycerate mutase